MAFTLHLSHSHVPKLTPASPASLHSHFTWGLLVSEDKAPASQYHCIHILLGCFWCPKTSSSITSIIAFTFHLGAFRKRTNPSITSIIAFTFRSGASGVQEQAAASPASLHSHFTWGLLVSEDKAPASQYHCLHILLGCFWCPKTSSSITSIIAFTFHLGAFRKRTNPSITSIIAFTFRSGFWCPKTSSSITGIIEFTFHLGAFCKRTNSSTTGQHCIHISLGGFWRQENKSQHHQHPASFNSQFTWGLLVPKDKPQNHQHRCIYILVGIFWCPSTNPSIISRIFWRPSIISITASMFHLGASGARGQTPASTAALHSEFIWQHHLHHCSHISLNDSVTSIIAFKLPHLGASGAREGSKS